MPQAGALLHEAEKQADAIPDASQKTEALFDAADAWVDAHSLEDARRVWRAMRAKETVHTIANRLSASAVALRTPHAQIFSFRRIGSFLWETSEKADLQIELRLQREAILQIRDASVRSIQNRLLAQDELSYGRASQLRSHGVKRQPVPASAGIPFPISVDGFRTLSKAERETRQKNDAVYLEQLYGFVGRRDFEGAWDFAGRGSPDSEKALGYASVEHLALQGGNFEIAERSANAIPEDREECSLWKAEALVAVATQHAKDGQCDRCVALFDSAKSVVMKVHADLQSGRALVMNEIADAEAFVGFAATSQEDAAQALKLAKEPPAVVTNITHVGTVGPMSISKLDDRASTFQALMTSRIKVKDLSGARAAADQWERTIGEDSYRAIADTWSAGNLEQHGEVWAKSRDSAFYRAEAIIALANVLSYFQYSRNSGS